MVLLPAQTVEVVEATELAHTILPTREATSEQRRGPHLPLTW